MTAALSLAGLDAAHAAWEAAFAPYDEDTYSAALAFLRPDDVVLDIGAGDLRFARRAAEMCRRVIAVEQSWAVLTSTGRAPRLANLDVICADALRLPVPRGVTVGILLMRHCRHYPHYAARLRAADCRRLVTNARWGMGVEQVALDAPRRPYHSVGGAWYGCACGAIGFAPGSVSQLDQGSLARAVEVAECPACMSGAATYRQAYR